MKNADGEELATCGDLVGIIAQTTLEGTAQGERQFDETLVDLIDERIGLSRKPLPPTPSERPEGPRVHCCKVGCDRLAEWEIREQHTKVAPESSFIHACEEHVGPLLLYAGKPTSDMKPSFQVIPLSPEAAADGRVRWMLLSERTNHPDGR